MADDKDLLASLTNTQLPAVPSAPEPSEPAEPTEVSRDEGERGKTPDEVVSRETRLPADKEPAPPAKPEDKRYEVRGIQYTAKELEAAGLLEDLAITHSKYEHLQKKHLEEKEKAAATPPKEEAPQVPQITNGMIAKAYDAAATAIVNDLVQSNLLENDLPEAYPRGVQTLIGQLRYAFDVIFSNQEKLDRLIAEVSSAKERVQSQVVANAYNQQLDALSKKDAKLYAGLKDEKIRNAFTKFLVEEVGATIGQTTGEKAPSFLAKQWVAFNSETVIEAAKNGVTEKKQAANRRLVVGEGTGSRTGVGDTGEQTVLERMIANSGKIAE